VGEEADVAWRVREARPFLKWAGGKRGLLPEIRANLPPGWDSGTYFEPFLGGGAVLLALQPGLAVAGDLNAELMGAYSELKGSIGGILYWTAFFLEGHSPSRYREIRGLDRNPGFAGMPPAFRAARLVYLNRTCFNGLYRVNSMGQFNVPPGDCEGPDPAEVCGDLSIAAGYLRGAGVTLLHGDFEAVLDRARAGDFAYLDPPYDGPCYTGYQAGGFGRDAQERLAWTYARLDAKGVRCLMSNADTPFVRKVYGGYTTVPVQARRSIAAKGASRGRAAELLIRNY
jgi:DNA adenine methylase